MPTTVVTALCRVRKHLADLNVFDNENSRSDPSYLHSAKIATRIYLIILLLALITLTVFISLSLESVSITIQHPSEVTYTNLQSEHSTTLSCQCSHTSIPYRNFTLTNVTYHPVCSSMDLSASNKLELSSCLRENNLKYALR